MPTPVATCTSSRVTSPIVYGRRQVLRAEEEKRLAEAKKAEDERRYREEQEKKQREQEEKKRRLEEAEKKRQALAQAQKAAAGGKANFKVGKKDDKVS